MLQVIILKAAILSNATKPLMLSILWYNDSGQKEINLKMSVKKCHIISLGSELRTVLIEPKVRLG
jgi:hypothetical protein